MEPKKISIFSFNYWKDIFLSILNFICLFFSSFIPDGNNNYSYKKKETNNKGKQKMKRIIGPKRCPKYLYLYKRLFEMFKTNKNEKINLKREEENEIEEEIE